MGMNERTSEARVDNMWLPADVFKQAASGWWSVCRGLG